MPNTYSLVIAGSLVLIASYLISRFSRKTNIPSPLILIVLGMILRVVMQRVGWGEVPNQALVLEVLGTVGLIFIVLEAALDLKLSRDKAGMIFKSLAAAVLGLGVSAGAIAWIFQLTMGMDWPQAFVYSIPLGILSSAIIIPSVGGLPERDREFAVYESTFSDIAGIMAFYLAISIAEGGQAVAAVRGFGVNFLLTIALAFALGYGLLLVLQRIRSGAKLALTLSVLLLIYSVQKMAGLSPLILILLFGLMVGNPKLFFPGRLRKHIDPVRLHEIHEDFHLVTLESAFVIRTFFFVMFGVSVVLASLADVQLVLISLAVSVSIYVLRWLVLLMLMRKSMGTLLWLAPRGLITILLFFQIGSHHHDIVHPEFKEGILLVVVFTTSIVMAIALIRKGLEVAPAIELASEEAEENTTLEAND
jgi:cell volume regulation protein A